MYRVVEVIRSKGSWGKSGKGLIEEASVGRGVRRIGREVDSRGVDIWIGGNVCHRGEEIVHHAWIVSIVDRRSDEARLQNVTPEETPAECHVVEVQQGRAIGKHRIDVDVLYVGQMRHRVVRQVEIAKVLYQAIVIVHLVHSHANLIEGVAGLPLVLTDNAQQAVEPTGDNDRRHRPANDGRLHVRTFFLSFLELIPGYDIRRRPPKALYQHASSMRATHPPVSNHLLSRARVPRPCAIKNSVVIVSARETEIRELPRSRVDFNVSIFNVDIRVLLPRADPSSVPRRERVFGVNTPSRARLRVSTIRSVVTSSLRRKRRYMSLTFDARVAARLPFESFFFSKERTKKILSRPDPNRFRYYSGNRAILGKNLPFCRN